MKARALVAWNVRRIRVDRGIPQEQLAYDAGIDRSYMGGLERQSENPTIDLLDRLAETLGACPGNVRKGRFLKFYCPISGHEDVILRKRVL